MTKKVLIYDTTLRDGTQGHGVTFSVADKIQITKQLASFGMDYIEGGWPGSNQKDQEFFSAAKHLNLGNTKLVAFGSTRKNGVKASDDKQVLALIEAETPAVAIFGKSWLLHVEEVLKVSRQENLEMITDTVETLKSFGREVIYDAEHFFDGYKANSDYATSTLVAATNADYIVLCDTNGGTMPDEIKAITAKMVLLFGNKIGIHTHNDCGLATANAIAAINAGATQVQGTMNGYGERVGNCNLTTLIPTLQLKLNIKTGQHTEDIRILSRFIDETANIQPDIRAPFVGDTAFAHKGGMHVNAVKKVAKSYEHVDPSLVGNQSGLLVSELSGRSNITWKAEQLGFKLTKEQTVALLNTIKSRESEGYEYEAADASVALLIQKTLDQHTPLFTLKEYHCSFRCCADNQNCEATVKLIVNNRPEYTVAEGDGPVNALDAALRKALRPFYPWVDEVTLTDYKVRIVDAHLGTAARTRVIIESTNGRESWNTVGSSFNIIEASWAALVDSLEYYGTRYTK